MNWLRFFGLLVCMSVECLSQGLIQNFLDFATLNNPVNTGTPKQTGFPPNSAFPPDTSFPPDAALPPETGFPPDPAFPPSKPIQPNSSVPQNTGVATNPRFPPEPVLQVDSTNVVDKLRSKDSMTGNTVPESGSGVPAERFTVNSLNTVVEPIGPAFPIFDVNPSDKNVNDVGNPNPEVTFRFLPSMPTGNKFIDLQTGTTNTFEPTDNWIGQPNQLEPDFPNFEIFATTDNAGSPINNAILNKQPIVPPNTIDVKPLNMNPAEQQGVKDQKPIEKGALMPTHQLIPIVGSAIKKGTTETPRTNLGSGPKVIPLDPAISASVIQGPVKVQTTTNTNLDSRVPESWMQLYPNGRKPPKNQIIANTTPLEAPVMSPADYILAQASLNSFGKNRDISIKLREDRKLAREKQKLDVQLQKQAAQQEKQQLKVEQQIQKQQEQTQKQQQQQGGPNNSRQAAAVVVDAGPQGAMIARMIIPPLNKPFTGKHSTGNSRGRRMAPKCKGKQEQLGLCSPDLPTLGKNKAKAVGPDPGHGGTKQKDPKVKSVKEMTPVDLTGTQSTLHQPGLPSNIESIPGFGMIDWGSNPP